MKKVPPTPRSVYVFLLIVSVALCLLSFMLFPFPGILFFLVGVFLVVGSLSCLFPGVFSRNSPSPPAPPASSSPSSPVPSAPSVSSDNFRPTPDGYLPNGDPFYFDDYDVVKTIRTKVVGVTYRNSDGSSRQENIACCSPGDPLELDYFSYRGSPAFSVSDGSGNQLGNLSAEIARVIFDLPPDLITYASVKQITGGDSSNYGCNIEILVLRKK